MNQGTKTTALPPEESAFLGRHRSRWARRLRPFAMVAVGLAFGTSCKDSGSPRRSAAAPRRIAASTPRPALDAGPSSSHADQTHRQAREAARTVLELHCGLCHRADLPTAKAGALAVFDLTRPRWQRRMRPDQLRDALRRLRERRTMSDLERSYLVPRGFPPAPRPTRAEVRRLRRFVELELRVRRSRGRPGPSAAGERAAPGKSVSRGPRRSTR